MKSTRAEAFTAGKKWYFTGGACPHGHVAPRQTVNGMCQECGRVRSRERMRAKLKDPEIRKAHYQATNARRRERYKADPAFRQEKLDAWRRSVAGEPRDRKNARKRAWLKANPGALLRERMSTALWHQMRGARKGKSVLEFIGCSVDELKAHLERQFAPGMTWENYGEWHVDHVMPCALFDHTNDDEVRMCWHFSNLQPMWAVENIAKKDRVSPGVRTAIERAKAKRSREKAGQPC